MARLMAIMMIDDSGEGGSLSVRPSVRPSVRWSVHHSICRFDGESVSQPFSQSAIQPVSLPASKSDCVSLSQSVTYCRVFRRCTAYIEPSVPGVTPTRPTGGLFGIISSILVLSSQSPSGPTGGAPDGHELGRGAAGPRGASATLTSAARARAELHWPHGTGQSHIGRTGNSESLART